MSIQDQQTAESSQQFLHPLIEHGPEAMLLLNAEGKILYANPALVSLPDKNRRAIASWGKGQPFL